MNIHTAAHYLNLGYRVRRTVWDPEQYLYEIAGMLEMVEVSYCSSWDHKTKAIVQNRSVGLGNVENQRTEPK